MGGVTGSGIAIRVSHWRFEGFALFFRVKNMGFNEKDILTKY